MVMQTIAAQEIKRQGIKAVDPLLARGAVQVIARNRPAYVVMDLARYRDLIAAAEAGYVARVLASRAAIERGEGHVYRTVEEHLAAVMAQPDDE